MRKSKLHVDAETPTAIACLPVLRSMQAGYVPYKNSVTRKCSKCKALVYVGPECMKRVKAEGLAIWCIPCLVKEYGADEVAGAMRPLTNKGQGE